MGLVLWGAVNGVITKEEAQGTIRNDDPLPVHIDQFYTDGTNLLVDYTILPGLMETAMAVDTRMRLTGRSREDIVAERNQKVPLRGRGGTGWDVANAAVFLASEEASFITGVDLAVDGGTLAKIGW